MTMLYKIPCTDFQLVYIAQTKAFLHYRIKQHKYNLKLRSYEDSYVVKHQLAKTKCQSK